MTVCVKGQVPQGACSYYSPIDFIGIRESFCVKMAACCKSLLPVCLKYPCQVCWIYWQNPHCSSWWQFRNLRATDGQAVFGSALHISNRKGGWRERGHPLLDKCVSNLGTYLASAGCGLSWFHCSSFHFVISFVSKRVIIVEALKGFGIRKKVWNRDMVLRGVCIRM